MKELIKLAADPHFMRRFKRKLEKENFCGSADPECEAFVDKYNLRLGRVFSGYLDSFSNAICNKYSSHLLPVI